MVREVPQVDASELVKELYYWECGWLKPVGLGCLGFSS